MKAFVDGRRATRLPVDDRGLAYGDGLFETIRFVAGHAPLWQGHMARLRRGCRILRLPAPDPAQLLAEAGQLVAGADALIKIILTRGGGRGYQPGVDQPVRRVVMRLPLPRMPASIYQRGLRTRWCRLRLADQPVLAGLKHLNRLEQVLARSEWTGPDIDEGLLLDGRARVVCATAANLFVVDRGRLLTPALTHSGVAGVARAWLLRRASRWLPVEQIALTPRQVERADEVFLSNAVRGVMPVTGLADRRFSVGPVTRRLAAALSAIGIGEPLDGLVE